MKKALLRTLTFGFSLAATSLSASPESEVALNYIKKLSHGNVDLAKHTALSPHCGIQRRKIIRERLNHLRKNTFRPDDSLTLETQKNMGNLAAVIIRATNPATPLSIRVHAIALIKKGTQWKPAPLPASFANTGYGYDEKIERSVRTLERWMAREKITRETQYRHKAKTDYLATIATIENNASLDTLTPEQAVMLLIKQFRKKNLLAILASMGAASNSLLDPIETTISLISQGLQEKSTSSDWYLVTNPSVIAQTLKIDHTRNEVAVGFFNPIKRKSTILYFPFHKSGGKTFIRLSPLLKIALLPVNKRWEEQWKHRRGDENELKHMLPATILKNTRPVTSDTPDKLVEHFLLALKNNNFSDCVSLLPRTGDYFGKKENQANSLLDLASLWASIHPLKDQPHHTPNILREKSLALAPLEFAQTNRPGQFETIHIWMLKNSNGWHILPTRTLKKPIGKNLLASSEKLASHSRKLMKNRREIHSRDFLAKVVTLTPPPTLAPPTTEDAKTIFLRFRNHLRAKDTESALSSCAILKGTSSTETLKTFNYALRGAADHINDDLILGISRSGKWTGISVRTESKLTHLHNYPLYLVVNTEKGPRVLLDIDLRHASNKGRKLINQKNWRKLEKLLPKTSLDNLKSLFAQHEKLTAKDIAAVIKLHE